MTEPKPWRFSESRPIHPFKVSSKALAAVAFRTRDDAPFSTEDPWFAIAEAEEITGGDFKPKFKFEVDQERLTAETGLSGKNVELTVILRDPALWRSERIAGWALADVPEEYEIPEQILSTISGARGLQLGVQLSPHKVLAPMFRTASRPGQIVASRTFTIGTPSDGSDFPIDLVDSSEFTKRGLPAETVWALHWLTEADFDQPADEVLSVMVNKEHGEKLLRLSSNDALGAFVWSEIAVEVFVEASLIIFGSDPPPAQDKEGLLAKITARLQKETGGTREDFVQKARDPIRGATYFRAHLQKGFEVASKIQRINLAGRS